MGKILELAKAWQPLVAILAVVGGVVWYFSGVESRLRNVETQVHTLAVAPTINDVNRNTISPNPVAETCARLAAQGADFTNYAMGERIKEMMSSLGCSSATNH